jgi:hypothetical protein
MNMNLPFHIYINTIHRKKRLGTFLSPAGMSLSNLSLGGNKLMSLFNLSLGGNNLIIPAQGEIGK